MFLFLLKICFLSLRQIFRPRSSCRRDRQNHHHWQHGPGPSSSPSPPDPRRRPFAALHPARTMSENRLNYYPLGAQATNTTATLNGRRRECDAAIIAQKRGRGGRHASPSRELVSKIFFPGKSVTRGVTKKTFTFLRFPAGRASPPKIALLSLFFPLLPPLGAIPTSDIIQQKKGGNRRDFLRGLSRSGAETGNEASQ